MADIKWRKYTPLPISTEPLVKGESASALKNIKYPKIEDFKGYPWGIVDFTTGKVTKHLTTEQYHQLFRGKKITE